MNNKYPYQTGYIYIPIVLDKAGMPQAIEIDGDKLDIKTDFHVSLVCVKDMITEHGEEIEQRVLRFFYAFVEENEVSLEGFTGEYRLAERNTEGEYRKTIVGMCIVSNLDNFYSELNKHLGTNFDNQPTHVTLYTLDPNKGIGLNNQTSFINMTRDITNTVIDMYPKIKSISYKI